MDKSYSNEEKSQRIQEVMRQMGLKKIENTKIGNPGAASSISGGEMKRLKQDQWKTWGSLKGYPEKV